MTDQLDTVLDFLIAQLTQAVGVAEPSLAVLINVLILALVAVVVVSRVKVELRSVEWTKRTPEDRRRMIYDILMEAWEFAEWMHSHTEIPTAEVKRAVAEEKKGAAVAYAQTELKAIGAANRDLATVSTRIEQVARERKNGLVRYSRRARVDQETIR
jgi:hypothetical protein